MTTKIQKAISKIYNPTPTTSVLPDISARPTQPEKIGSARNTASKGDTGVSNAIRYEVITVYSHLIITEDGAFERPHNWPTSGAYPAGTPVPSPLPDSLKIDTGTLTLDTAALYYEQKRVHAIVMESGGVLAEDHFLIPLATPFEGGFYRGPAAISASYAPDLFLKHIPSPDSLTSSRVSELAAMGIVVE